MNNKAPLNVQIHLDGKIKKRDRYRANVSLNVDEAVTLMRQVSAHHELHVVGECDLKQTFKETLDEEVATSTILSMIHLPTSHDDLAGKLGARTLLFPISMVFTWSANENVTEVQAVDPLTKSAHANESLRPTVRKLRKTLKHVFKQFCREALARAATAPAEGGGPSPHIGALEGNSGVHDQCAADATLRPA